MQTTSLKGSPVDLLGKSVDVGNDAPAVSLVTRDLEDFVVGGKKDHVQLIVCVPSLDTPVCASETRAFNSKASTLEGVQTTIVSMDLPFAQKRFCSTEGIDNLSVVSDFRNKDFGNAYGMLLGSSALAGVLARAIFVVDTNGKITYKQLVPEVTAEPNYEEAIEAAQAAK